MALLKASGPPPSMGRRPDSANNSDNKTQKTVSSHSHKKNIDKKVSCRRLDVTVSQSVGEASYGGVSQSSHWSRRTQCLPHTDKEYRRKNSSESSLNYFSNVPTSDSSNYYNCPKSSQQTYSSSTSTGGNQEDVFARVSSPLYDTSSSDTNDNRCDRSAVPCARAAWCDAQKWTSLLVMVTLLLVTVTGSAAFETMTLMTELRPRVVVRQGEHRVQSFYGNQSHTDHFRLLQRDGDYILIGARNIVFNISTLDLTEDYSKRIVWQSTNVDSQSCYNKGKSQSDCQNYIRVLAKKSDGEFLVCGTNAYKPRCRDYSIASNGSSSYIEVNGIGKCPYDPRHNSTFVFAGGELYSGTVADFQGTIPLIFREPVKTDHNDLKQLNAPDFIHSFRHGEYVFFFLRETAVEYMNCGKRVYSRVARVCMNDMGGGLAMYQNFWTSFLKSRLNCSVPGEFPFYLDEIHSASDVVEGVYAGSSHSLVYAIFSTPPNSIPGSAVCVFSMQDIQEAFEGRFKQQENMNANWLPVNNNKVPEPRPGSCVENSQALPEENMNFVKTHPLMDQAVPTFYNKPLLVKASFDYRLSKLAVDPQVPLLGEGEGAIDVLFLATDSGVIIKMVNTYSAHTKDEINSVIIEEIRLFDVPTPVANLQLAQQTTGDTKLIIITDDAVTAVPLQRCHLVSNCSACVGLQDPYCAWFEGAGVCGAAHGKLSGPVFQNVSSGVHYQCPKSGENNLLSPVEAPAPVTGAPAAPPAVCPPCRCPDPPLSSPPTPPLFTPTHSAMGGSDDTHAEESSSSEGDIDAQSAPPLLGPSSNAIAAGEVDDAARPTVLEAGGRYGRGRGLPLPPPTEIVGIVYAEGPTAPHPGPVIGASSTEGAPIYSAETLAIAVTTACVAALVIGFISGFLFSRKCRGEDMHGYSDTPYLESKLNKCDNLVPVADQNMYSSSKPQQHFNNLVTNFNPKNTNGKSNTNTTTDIKPAKCAYI